MSQFTFTSSFWSWWVIALTIANILGCWWLIAWTKKRRAGEAPIGEVTGHTWDGDLQEYNNPMPGWWLWLFYLTLIFSGIYLLLFPGLGSFQGVLGWTSAARYDSEMARAEVKYGPVFERYAGQDLAVVARDPEAIKIGQRLFLNYCASCHGSDAGGGPGFPNLRDGDWLWGGEPLAIKASILDGRTGVMPAWGPIIGAEGVEQTTAYVLSLNGRSVDPELAAAGRQVFETTCAACHGADAKGNPLLGAPNLTNNTWLHGGSPGMVAQSIANGRTGVMPAHREFLGEAKAHLLAAYVYSLSAGQR
jgi:cytochrome c oxidase cbb3-type subunit III